VRRQGQAAEQAQREQRELVVPEAAEQDRPVVHQPPVLPRAGLLAQLHHLFHHGRQPDQQKAHQHHRGQHQAQHRKVEQRMAQVDLAPTQQDKQPDRHRCRQA
jgi:hypothetical protein